MEHTINRETKEKITKILNSFDEEILIISKDFRIIQANKAFLCKWGFTESEIIGDYCYRVTHHRESQCEPPNDICPIKGVLRTGRVQVEQHVHFDKAGKRYFVSVAAVPITINNNPLVFLHVVSNLRERVVTRKSIGQILRKTERLGAMVNNL